MKKLKNPLALLLCLLLLAGALPAASPAPRAGQVTQGLAERTIP